MTARRRAAVAAVLAAAAAGSCAAGDRPVAVATTARDAAALPGCPSPGAEATAASALPDLALPCLAGGTGAGAPLPLRRLTGTPTVLNLWASWCAPCREELPAFARLDRDADSRLRVLGVASQDRAGAALSYAADAALPFPSLQDESGELGRALRRPGLPVTVLVAPDGSVVEVYQGPPLTDAGLRGLVREKLGVDVG